MSPDRKFRAARDLPDSELAAVQLGAFYLRHGEPAKARAACEGFAATHPSAEAVRELLRTAGTGPAPR